MDEITSKIEYLIEKYPEKVIDFAKYMYKHNPEMVEKMLEYPQDYEHITNKYKYEELVNKIKWADGANNGAKWSLEDIKKNSKINFYNTDYTEYDYAYLVNMLYAKCHKYITDPSIYLKLAKCLLEDSDEETKIYRGTYYNKNNQNQYSEQAYYNERFDDMNKHNEDYRHRNTYGRDRINPYENRTYIEHPHNNDFFRQK